MSSPAACRGGLNPVAFAPSLQAIRVIRVICEICGLNWWGKTDEESPIKHEKRK